MHKNVGRREKSLDPIAPLFWQTNAGEVEAKYSINQINKSTECAAGGGDEMNREFLKRTVK